MLIGRDRELEALNKRYGSGKFEYMVVYGDPKTGKTALINEFCHDKPTIYFSALNATLGENLKALSKAIAGLNNLDSVADAQIFGSLDIALDEITRLSEKSRVVFVIDDCQYLAEADPSWASRLQYMIDHKWQNTQLYLILCGSSKRFMEYKVLGYDSPLFGRRTGQVKLQELPYRELKYFYPRLSCDDLALLYGITGGIPQYIEKLDVCTNIDDSLLNSLFNPTSYLFEEPRNLLTKLTRSQAVYNTILAAVAHGCVRMHTIGAYAEQTTPICGKYLSELLNMGLIRKESPFQSDSKKTTKYYMSGNFLRFWYRFVPENMSDICSGKIYWTYTHAVKEFLNDYMQGIFVQICRDYILRYATLPYLVLDIGSWWQTQSDSGIDIIASTDEGVYIAGTCKYGGEVGTEDLAKLMSAAKIFSPDSNFHYCLFSNVGFTEELTEEASRQTDISLYTLDDLYK